MTLQALRFLDFKALCLLAENHVFTINLLSRNIDITIVALVLYLSNDFPFSLLSLQVPLRYLIAMLFVNFRPLWDAVIELLV